MGRVALNVEALPGRSRGTRFSEEESVRLVELVQQHKDTIYGTVTKNPRPQEVHSSSPQYPGTRILYTKQARLAWEAIAEIISSESGITRSFSQCRKRYNDLKRRGVMMVAARKRGRPPKIRPEDDSDSMSDSNVHVEPEDLEFEVQAPMDEDPDYDDPDYEPVPKKKEIGRVKEIPASTVPAKVEQVSAKPQTKLLLLAPSQAKQSATPSQAKQSATPSQAKPPATPSQSKSGTPSQAKTPATPSQAKPSATPSQSKPGTPSQAKPSGTPSQAKPSATPSQAKPSGTPSQAKPSGTPSQAKPSGTPSQAKPSGTPSQAKPLGSPSQNGTPSPSLPKPKVTLVRKPLTGPTRIRVEREDDTQPFLEVQKAGFDMLKRELSLFRDSVMSLNTRLNHLEVALRPIGYIGDSLSRIANAVERLTCPPE